MSLDSTVVAPGQPSTSQREIMVVVASDGVRLALDTTGYGTLGLAELNLALEVVRNAGGLEELIEVASVLPGGNVDRLRHFYQLLADQVLNGSDVDHIESAGRTASAEAPPDSLDTPLVVLTPLVLRLNAVGYEALDHNGNRLVALDPSEVDAMVRFSRPTTVLAVAPHTQMGEADLAALTYRLQALGLVHRVDATFSERDASSRTEREWRDAMANLARIGDRVEEQLADRDANQPNAAIGLTPLVGVHPHGPCPPLGIAMVMAYAETVDDGRLKDHYDFFPRWVMTKDRLPTFTDCPGIFLFSNYLWSVQNNLEISAAVKEQSPGSITIHGGPDTPKYEADVELFFHNNPQVDVAVRGEGEATFAAVLTALAEIELDDEQPDLSPLSEVAGVCFRRDGEVVRTPDRDRITDIDIIPSPYLVGMFDAYSAASESTAIIETNRGCPYSCTFCDWGSATASRIRKFDLQRVFDELEWCAKNKVNRIWLADANFGIFERDVEIAQTVARLKAEFGYPKVFGTNYAKNTVKHLQTIVKVMADAGILTEGLLSLQSMDEGTLNTIRRSNIKVEKYDALAKEFRAASLPLYVDLMVGLPGSTLDSFRNDLQECIEREVSARIFSTTLLTNSPMNEPTYREENRIETEMVPGGQHLVVSSASFTREDHDAMLKLREIYIMCENHGILRQVSRYVRQAAGTREVDLYESMWRAARANPDRWPALTFVFEAGPSLMVPPVSWQIFIDEVRDYLVREMSLDGGGPLETVLAVQHGLLPARNRIFPDVLELRHDFGAWHQEMVAAKENGDRASWPSRARRLEDFGPIAFPIDDPHRVCVLNMGYHVEGDIYSDWELRSPVARSMPATHMAT